MPQLDSQKSDKPAPEALPAPPKRSGGVLYGAALGVVSTALFFFGAAAGEGRLNPLTLLPKEEVAPSPDETAPPEPVSLYVELPLSVYEIRTTTRQNYMSARIALQVPADQQARVEAAMPEIADTVQGYVRHLEPTMLQGALGLYDLRQALLHRTQHLLGPDAVEAVLITELLIG